MNEFLDDKLHVIWALAIIAGMIIWKIPEQADIVNSIVSGLLGVAVGRGVR